MAGPCTPLGARTTVLSLCKPAAGEVPWQDANNGNFDTLDAMFFGAQLLRPANGGSGVDASAAANGKTLIGNGSGFTLALPTGSASIVVTAGAGTLALDTSQNVSTGGSPTFNGLTVVGAKAMMQFFPAVNFCSVTSSTTLPVTTRFAANNYGLSRTAGGAETINWGFTLPMVFSATALKGTRILTISIVHQITVASLTSDTLNDVSRIAYVDNVANAITQFGGGLSISMPTVARANPYVSVGTLNSPVFMTTAAAQLSLDWTTVLQNTTVYTVYGVIVTFDFAGL